MLMYRRRASASVPSVHSKTIAALLTTASWCLRPCGRMDSIVTCQSHNNKMPVTCQSWILTA